MTVQGAATSTNARVTACHTHAGRMHGATTPLEARRARARWDMRAIRTTMIPRTRPAPTSWSAKLRPSLAPPTLLARIPMGRSHARATPGSAATAHIATTSMSALRAVRVTPTPSARTSMGASNASATTAGRATGSRASAPTSTSVLLATSTPARSSMACVTTSRARTGATVQRGGRRLTTSTRPSRTAMALCATMPTSARLAHTTATWTRFAPTLTRRFRAPARRGSWATGWSASNSALRLRAMRATRWRTARTLPAPAQRAFTEEDTGRRAARARRGRCALASAYHG
mmetsp:Transcript_3761/g.5542  ORF Transcript_3761/g.5542 Transcript_3761/m.5542 type:complete len:289 (-) Transcript_3761:1144-2010(-)